jgi:hypothetical protein
MMPPFGSRRIEQLASILLLFAGAAGLAISVRGDEIPIGFIQNPGRSWLVFQSVLVIVGGMGALVLRRLFSVLMLGIISGIVFITPVGIVTSLPALLMLLLVLPKFESFWEFTPKWRGPGNPPPGHWR